jgi:hypothetical protein
VCGSLGEVEAESGVVCNCRVLLAGCDCLYRSWQRLLGDW